MVNEDGGESINAPLFYFMQKVYPIIVIALCVLLYNTCGSIKKLKSDISVQADYYSGNEKKLTKKVNDLGQELSRQNLSLIESRAARKKLESEIKDLKQLKSKVDVVIQTQYDSVVVAIHDTIQDENVISVPKYLHYQSEWLSFNQVIGKSFVRVDSLKIKNDISITVGKFKTGLLRSEYQAEVKLSNPHSTTTSMKSVMVKENKRKSFFAGVGIGAALIASLIIISR